MENPETVRVVEGSEALELDNANFVVGRKEYEAFLAALDEPPKSIPALRKLFVDQSSLDTQPTKKRPGEASTQRMKHE